MEKEKSCGVITLKKVNGNIFVLLVHHVLGHWGIPKGHMEIGEEEVETAVREVFEETAIAPKIISGFREVSTYPLENGTTKEVVFFLGKPIFEHIVPQKEEITEAKFFDVKEAILQLTYQNERQVLEKAIQAYQSYLEKE